MIQDARSLPLALRQRVFGDLGGIDQADGDFLIISSPCAGNQRECPHEEHTSHKGLLDLDFRVNRARFTAL
jgi:hypothetical protein